MNKEIIELKEQRTEAIEGLNAIVGACKEEKRSKSEEEVTQFAELEARIEEIDAQIEEAEKLERLNESIVKKQPMKEEKKVAQRYNIAKAIKEQGRGGNLTGLEKEMHDEAKRTFGHSEGLLVPDFLWQKEARADYSYSGQAATDVATDIAGLDVLATQPLYERLGCTVYRGLSNKTILNFSDGHVAAAPGEGVTVAESTPTRASATLDPVRYGGKKGFTNELLSTSSVMNVEFADMVEALDRAISTSVISAANLANINSAREAADTAAALTWADAIAIQADLESDNFRSEGYVMSKPLYHNAQGIAKDSGSGRFVVEMGMIEGVPAFGTTQLPIHDTNKYDFIYGDWARAYIGLFGNATELLVDPYTDSAIGVTNIVFSRLADTAVNPSAFQSYRNVSLA